ncbi:MAG: competence/damage-inducible protein A [Clostridiales bacterium]|jgi:nicotinamide-nucleotide amidase|nr:competence/damage-inducible protein A [Clostridiales bacterium]
MTAEIISVGTELLMGQIVNTNAQYLSQKLASLGINVYHQATVGDNPARLKETVRHALSRADIIVLSGGLGPTGDDLTKEAVADALARRLVRFADAEETLRARFLAMGRDMTPNNLRQADFPDGSELLKNPNGTAQGCILRAEDKIAILLPGPPQELIPMFENEVAPRLEKLSGVKLYSREIRVFGMGESSVEYALRDLMRRQDNPTIAPYAKTGEVTLRVTARCEDETMGEALSLPVIDEIKKRLGDVVYSTSGVTLAGVCAGLLMEKNATLAVAESCTGGLLSSVLVDIPGISDCFMEGAATYSDLAKCRRLGVLSATLDAYGAVSAECAKEMALGMRRGALTDYALSVTGIAGPGGGTAKKPVGLVYVALADEERATVKKVLLSGDRARIRALAVLHALDLLRRRLCGLPVAQE